MATRSTISFYKEGIVKTIYCHWDGYLSHNGIILLQHYNTIEKIEELFSFGDCSSLDEEISKCEFYARDRNETGTECREYNVGSVTNVKQIEREESEEYDYLFYDNCWHFIGYSDVGDGIGFDEWTILTPNLCK